MVLSQPGKDNSANPESLQPSGYKSSSLGAANGLHRINRRKSSSFHPTANVAAIEAAVEHAVAEPFHHRRSSVSKAALAALNDGLRPPMPTLHHSTDGTVITDGPSLASYTGDLQKHRRASDGSKLSKKDKILAPSDLKCEHCGKAYKHGSCLSKHL